MWLAPACGDTTPGLEASSENTNYSALYIYHEINHHDVESNQIVA